VLPLVRQTDRHIERHRICVCVCVCVCVSEASVTQHAMRMRRIVISSVVCPALQYFFHRVSQIIRFSENGFFFNPKICVLVFSLQHLSGEKMPHYIKNSARYCCHECTEQLFMSKNLLFYFFNEISMNLQSSLYIFTEC